MGRLIPQALYRDRIAELHIAKDQASRDSVYYSDDWTDYGGMWSRAAKRAQLMDPEGRESYAMLKHLMLQKKLADSETKIVDKIKEIDLKDVFYS